MRNVVKVYNNHRRFVRLQRKKDKCKRKRELTEHIKIPQKKIKSDQVLQLLCNSVENQNVT